jgi:hypothetical protein
MAYVTRHHAAVERIDPGPNVTFVRIKGSGGCARSPDAHRGVEPRLGDHEKTDARAVRIAFAVARHDPFVDQLHQVGLFAACSRKDLQKVAERSEDRRVTAGTTIVNEGDDGDELFVIIDGTARVSRQSRKFAALGNWGRAPSGAPGRPLLRTGSSCRDRGAA